MRNAGIALQAMRCHPLSYAERGEVPVSPAPHSFVSRAVCLHSHSPTHKASAQLSPLDGDESCMTFRRTEHVRINVALLLGLSTQAVVLVPPCLSGHGAPPFGCMSWHRVRQRLVRLAEKSETRHSRASCCGESLQVYVGPPATWSFRSDSRGSARL